MSYVYSLRLPLIFASSSQDVGSRLDSAEIHFHRARRQSGRQYANDAVRHYISIINRSTRRTAPTRPFRRLSFSFWVPLKRHNETWPFAAIDGAIRSFVFFPSAKGFTFTDRGHQAGKNMADRIVFEGPHTLIITFSTVSQVPSILRSVGEKEIAGWLGFLYGSQLLERQTFLVSFSALVRFLKIPAHGRLYVG